MACHSAFENPNNIQLVQFDTRPAGAIYSTIPEIKMIRNDHPNEKLTKPFQKNFFFIRILFFLFDNWDFD